MYTLCHLRSRERLCQGLTLWVAVWRLEATGQTDSVVTETNEQFCRTVNPILSLFLIIDLDLILGLKNIDPCYIYSPCNFTLKLIQPIIEIWEIQGEEWEWNHVNTRDNTERHYLDGKCVFCKLFAPKPFLAVRSKWDQDKNNVGISIIHHSRFHFLSTKDLRKLSYHFVFQATCPWAMTCQ